MKRLDAGDAADLLGFVSELKDVDDPLAFPPLVLRGLAGAHPERRRLVLGARPPPKAIPPSGVDRRPGRRSGVGRRATRRPTDCSGSCGRRTLSAATGKPRVTGQPPSKRPTSGRSREFRRTAIYDALYRGELDHWFDFGLPPLPDRTRVFIFVRHKAPDFTERDRLVASLVRPHLEARAREADAAARASAALAAVGDGADSEGHPVVLCSSNGAIEFASPCARALLKRYLGVDNGKLPAALLGRKRLALEDGDGRLTIRVARTGGLRLLMLDERRPAPRAPHGARARDPRSCRAGIEQRGHRARARDFTCDRRQAPRARLREARRPESNRGCRRDRRSSPVGA